MGVVIAVVSAALASLVVHCAPNVGPTTMTAIVAYESGARPYAIGDNTARRSYAPSDVASAIALAASLARAGHNIDVGLAQINSDNFARYGLDLARAFDPCTNVATASRILGADYASAVRRYGPGGRSLTYALSAYNTGGFFSGYTYARGVYATAASLRIADREAVVFTPHRTRVPQRAVPFVSARRGDDR